MLGERLNHGINFTRPRSKLVAKLTMAAMLSTGLAVATATPQAWSQAAQSSGRSDADIQSDVAYALSNSSALKGQQITAATVEGDVTISGHVRDAASKELAESLLYRVNGVRSVTNNLVVGDAAPEPAQGQVTGGENTVQSVDPNVIAQQDPNGDLNYDPAQQNMAPAGPQDNAQAPPPPPPPAQQDNAQGAPYPNQYPGERQPYPGYSPNTGQYPAQPQYSAQPQQPATPVT